MNDQEKQKFEQALAAIRDGMPRMFFALYEGSKDAGFSEQQSFDIVLTYVAALASKPTDPL